VSLEVRWLFCYAVVRVGTRKGGMATESGAAANVRGSPGRREGGGIGGTTTRTRRRGRGRGGSSQALVKKWDVPATEKPTLLLCVIHAVLHSASSPPCAAPALPANHNMRQGPGQSAPAVSVNARGVATAVGATQVAGKRC